MSVSIEIDHASKTTQRPPLRVVHLVSALNIGGLEKVVFDLVRLTDPQRVTVRVVCLGKAGHLESAFHDLGVRVESLDVLGKGTLKATLALARWLRAERPDVLHTHNPSPHVVGALAAKLAGVGMLVHTKHGRNYPGDRWRVRLNRMAAWLGSRVVAVSENVARVAIDIERVPPGKVQVIWNGIDLERFRPSYPTSGPVRRAIHVARIMDPPKDHGTLLRAVRRVVDAVPDFTLDIVGDGPHRTQTEALCRELGLERQVRFLGFRSDIHALLTQCDVFLLSTTTEGLSITLLEAMASGLPVVTTNVGGNPEVVAEGETGLLVPAGSPREMADAILALVRDPERARAYGAAGRKRVEAHFDLRKTVERYCELYETLSARHAKRAGKAAKMESAK